MEPSKDEDNVPAKPQEALSDFYNNMMKDAEIKLNHLCALYKDVYEPPKTDKPREFG